MTKTSRSNEVCNEFVYLGGDFGTHKGSFSSPGYPTETYPNRERCTWIVKVPLDYRVALYFSDFDVESCPTQTENCTCDYVEISDGQLFIDRRISKLCGNKIPPNVLSSGRFLRIDLVTDATNPMKGFNAHFYSVSSDGSTLSTVDVQKNPKSVPPATDTPKKGGSSTTMIAVICSLLGVVLIGVFLLLVLVKKKHAQDNRRRSPQLQLGRSVSSTTSQRNNLPSEPPPPYSSVVNASPTIR